jgi:hypothetical protein
MVHHPLRPSLPEAGPSPSLLGWSGEKVALTNQTVFGTGLKMTEYVNFLEILLKKNRKAVRYLSKDVRIYLLFILPTEQTRSYLATGPLCVYLSR